MTSSVSQNLWRPLLEGELRERALATVEAIVGALPDPGSDEIPDVSLSGGAAGLAVFCAYLSRAGLDNDDNATQFLAQAVNAASSQPMGPSLYGGFTGIGWTAAHLQEQLLDPEEDPNEDVDETLKAYLAQSAWQDHYDLIIGLVGIGVYALERPGSQAASECLGLVIDRLAETAEHNADGVAWLTDAELLPQWQRELCPKGYYNLGLAHGLPGVIALLGLACAAGCATAKARPLLEGAVSYLLSQKLTDEKVSAFPSWITPNTEPSDCRLAWCYGDAGVAAALLLAARCVDNPAWEREALLIARRAAERAPEQTGVKDAGLCHGAAGLGHIFNRIFQATGDQVFAGAARQWFERTLEMRRPGKGIAGFSAARPDTNGQENWEDAVGILEGAAGIALALLGASSTVEPAWDRMLLVSIPVAQ